MFWGIIIAAGVGLAVIVILGFLLVKRSAGAEAADTGARGWRSSSPNRPLVRPDPESAAPLARLLAAIREVESPGGWESVPDGDGGRAVGPYQIHRAYWADSGLAGRYEDCRREPYARRVVHAYMRRYEPCALSRVDAEGPRAAAQWRAIVARPARDAGVLAEGPGGA